MFAVIKTGGKQYKVAEGDVLTVEKLALSTGSASSPQANSGQAPIEGEVIFEEVLLVVNGEIKIGNPNVGSAKVFAKVIGDGKAKKKMVFRYKSKTRQHKKKGHRQPFTKVQITKITA